MVSPFEYVTGHKSVTVVFFVNELPAYVYGYLINSFIVNLLHMEAVVDNVGVVEKPRTRR